MQESHLGFMLGNIIFLIAIIMTLRTVIEEKRSLLATIVLAGMGFVFSLKAQNNNVGSVYGIIGNVIYALFLFSAVMTLTRRLIIEKNIQVDTIKGGICVYFLIGFLWKILYSIIFMFDNFAFVYRSTNCCQQSLFQYYSFTVLTTLGFGDIIPRNPWAVNLTLLEAVTGQMFIAIFIARLIGLYIAREMRKE